MIDDAELSYLFYSGVSWEHLTLDQQNRFNRLLIEEHE